MEIKTTEQISRYPYNDLDAVKWVRVDELIINLKLIRHVMKTNKEITDGIDDLIKELKP